MGRGYSRGCEYSRSPQLCHPSDTNLVLVLVNHLYFPVQLRLFYPLFFTLCCSPRHPFFFLKAELLVPGSIEQFSPQQNFQISPCISRKLTHHNHTYPKETWTLLGLTFLGVGDAISHPFTFFNSIFALPPLMSTTSRQPGTTPLGGGRVYPLGGSFIPRKVSLPTCRPLSLPDPFPQSFR